MIVICCAMYCEAAMLIRHYALKKTEYSAFQIYENADKSMLVVITGVGKNASSTAVGTIAGKYSLDKHDYIINFGIAAGNNSSIGRIFAGNKLVDASYDRCFYPDMLLTSQMEETTIITSDIIVMEIEDKKHIVYDMEAAAIYQAANHFIGPHQMSFIKLVSDDGNSSRSITREDIEKLILQKQDEIIEYIDMVVTNQNRMSEEELLLSVENERLFERVCEDMKCSKTMERELLQQFRYHELSGNKLKDKIKEMYEEEKLPCIDKKRGKVYLDELRRAVLQ